MKYLSIIVPALFALTSFVIESEATNNKPKKKKCNKKGKGKKCAGGGGDPHFRTLDGTLYSFHGECDLVMADSPAYASGLGLEIHARTKIVSDWSLISNLALRIGGDIFEITNDGSHYFNGNKDVELPLQLAGKYVVTKGEDMISTFEEDGTSNEVAQQMYTIHLDNDDEILISVFRSMITINVEGAFEGTRGLLGTDGLDGMTGRDGTTFEDATLMGMDWQVNIDLDEPMLFHDVVGAQYPERCLMPSTTSRRRLKKYSDVFLQLATETCAEAPVDLRELCFNDILRTGDMNIALGYAF